MRGLQAILSKPVAVGGAGATLSYSVRGCTNCTAAHPRYPPRRPARARGGGQGAYPDGVFITAYRRLGVPSQQPGGWITLRAHPLAGGATSPWKREAWTLPADSELQAGGGAFQRTVSHCPCAS